MAENDIIIVSDIASGIAPKALVNPKASVSLAPFADSRGVDPKLVMDKIRLGGGFPRGSYLAEEPVAGLVAMASAAALSKAGYKLAEKDADFTVAGNLTGLKFHVTMGFAKAMLRGEITVFFTVAQNGKDEPAAAFSVTGHGRTGAGDVVADVFKTAVEDLAVKLAEHPLLAGLF